MRINQTIIHVTLQLLMVICLFILVVILGLRLLHYQLYTELHRIIQMVSLSTTAQNNITSATTVAIDTLTEQTILDGSNFLIDSKASLIIVVFPIPFSP